MPVHSNRLQAPARSFLYLSQTAGTTFTRLATSGTYSRQTRLQRTSTEELCLQSYSYPYDWYFRRRWFSVLQALILSVPTFGSILLPTTLWIRSLAPLGTRVCRLTSLRSIRLVCLHYSHLLSLLVLALFVTCTKHGKLETSPELLYGTFPVQSLAIFISLRRLRIPWLRLRGRVCPLSGRYLLVSPSAPVMDVSTGSSSTCSFRLRKARSRSPTSLKAPLVRLRPRGDVSSVVTGALPGLLSARCVSCQFPCSYNNNFPCPLIIHRVRSSSSWGTVFRPGRFRTSRLGWATGTYNTPYQMRSTVTPWMFLH